MDSNDVLSHDRSVIINRTPGESSLTLDRNQRDNKVNVKQSFFSNWCSSHEESLQMDHFKVQNRNLSFSAVM